MGALSTTGAHIGTLTTTGSDEGLALICALTVVAVGAISSAEVAWALGVRPKFIDSFQEWRQRVRNAKDEEIAKQVAIATEKAFQTAESEFLAKENANFHFEVVQLARAVSSPKLDGAIAKCIRDGENGRLYLVRKPGETEIVAMNESDFSKLRRTIADNDQILTIVSTTSAGVASMRYVGGTLDGTTPEAPAVIRIEGGKVSVDYWHKGCGLYPDRKPGEDINTLREAHPPTQLDTSHVFHSATRR